MRRVSGSRRDHVGVLRRRPPLDPRVESALAPISPRRMAEVRQLLRLVDRGLLSEEEFDAQVRKIYGNLPAR